MIKTREEGAALLERRLEESGLSTERFATDVMIRQARTVRRWLDRSSPLPGVVLEWLQEPRAAPWPAPALADVPEEDRARFAEEVSTEIVSELRGRLHGAGVCDVCGGPGR